MKTGLTLEQHRAMGRQLKRIHEQLLSVSGDVSRAYPLKSRVYRLACGADAALNKLRCELDNLLCGEIPLDSNDWRHVYYGPSEAEGASHDLDRRLYNGPELMALDLPEPEVRKRQLGRRNP